MAKYEKIAESLRERIRSGEWAPGSKLPSETPDLTNQYKTSLPTIRQALAVLAAEGTVDKVHGKGNFVRKPRQLVTRSNERHQWEKDRARQSQETRQQTGATERDTGLTLGDLEFSAEFRQVEAASDLADLFAVPAGTALLERTYRTSYRDEGVPLNLARSYLVYEAVQANPDLLDASREPWPGGTQNQLFTIGIELDRIEERVTARPPTPDEAEELDLRAGVAVFVLRKICYDTEGRVVEVSNVVLPGDRTEMVFTTPLKRW
ncbi:GntR family transcriptional regulator [Streptomyces sp. TLI_171]|uniref:GntR family transcriptional regulator n=1 Tax=Streptomyces sp. TLI_171 TaxID=1938859 RepID=UPI000C19B01B|nr:GntR family transcriptional regulator [Streptomyces sp. TLI_171]RKE19614.1 GntR family transcriptional regulator [Streptomyces sp. TLI_171]